MDYGSEPTFFGYASPQTAYARGLAFRSVWYAMLAVVLGEIFASCRRRAVVFLLLLRPFLALNGGVISLQFYRNLSKSKINNKLHTKSTIWTGTMPEMYTKFLALLPPQHRITPATSRSRTRQNKTKPPPPPLAESRGKDKLVIYPPSSSSQSHPRPT